MSKSVWEFEHSVKCRANQSFAWSFWTDVSNWERIEGKAVEWIKLKGPFAVGASGVTKVPSQDPHHWEITQFDPQCSTTIEMPLEGAKFYNSMAFESDTSGQTLITQRLYLTGPKASSLMEGIKTFEISAPQGLAKLAKAIELAFEDRTS